jgi:predicted metal-dependent HD superfamily phosphohydrolase
MLPSMKSNTSIVKIVQKYVTKLFAEKLPKAYQYHNLSHTEDVVRGAREIAKAMNVTADEMQIVTLAAWFHDTGYTLSGNNHEAHGIKIAQAFLGKRNFPKEQIEQIVECIRATKMPQKPKSLLEKILCDADLLYLGKPRCIERAEFLRRELQNLRQEEISQIDWLKDSAQFFKKHRFHTSYVKSKYDPIRQKNLQRFLKKHSQLKKSALR